ncbi:hypothetical protein GUY44_26060 [Pimelobacter simplex]|uniref:Uncharacterized protein n=1 Tax=Nocardioides simplex TaxID=2045 RepID=A0A0A1DJ50_NOCSI|nr:hypothetical protein [Pimelobacter simplex]AIY16573.1 hypothetical protein KR76_06975 [Pimelobacter simplex]MCG8153967.1 hypothetical protein [Pimelobacter simplex]GEB15376.1 hypothetical protein NSI01_36910 [Pimelobacter simplex]SFN14286.1 hypothetical protein SAMN05421671_5369 [Pimelobacter simplex]
MTRQNARLLLAVSALAASALLAGCGDDVTPAAAADDAPAAPALTTEALLTDADTVYSDGADWFRTGAGEGDGQSVLNPCAEQALAGTGATSVVRGDYELRNSEPGAPGVEGDSLVQVVARYDDEAAATQAWSTVNGWLEECAARPAELTDYRALQTRKVAVPGADAVITDSHLGPVAEELDPTGDAAYIMETGVLRKGTELVVLTSVIVGQDYDFVGPTPIEQMLPRAAARL